MFTFCAQFHCQIFRTMMEESCRKGAATLQFHDHLLMDCGFHALLVSLELMLLVETQTANLKHHHGANVSDDEQ